LRNMLERAAIVCDGELITSHHLPPPALSSRPGTSEPAGPDAVMVEVGTNLDDVEKAVILKTLARHSNNKTQAAQTLGISLKTLHNKLRRYGL